MKSSHQRRGDKAPLFVCALIAAIVASSLSVPVAHAELPPRPQLNDADEQNDEAPMPPPTTGQIHLYIRPANEHYWSVVQWQDSSGTWRDVSGWKGDVAGGHIMWWVAEKDFGAGPFRWAVYQNGGPVVERGENTFLDLGDKALLATSDSFELPDQNRSLAIHLTVGTSKTRIPATPRHGPGAGYSSRQPTNNYRQAYRPPPYRRPVHPRYLPYQRPPFRR